MRTERDSSKAIEAAAADWVARVDAGPLSADEEKQLEAWLAGDVRRLGAYARAQAFSIHGERAAALGAAFDGARIEGARPGAPPRATRRQALQAGGLGLAAAFAGGGVLLLSTRGEAHATARGEILQVPLDDGSMVTLNTETRILVRYDDQRRHIVLQSGEAFFDAVRNPARPFSVQAGDARVQAEGAAFAVSRLPQRPVSITVSTGEVEALTQNRRDRAPVRVPANRRAEAVAASGGLTVAALDADQVSRVLAWRGGKLAFEGQTLAEAAGEFARYSPVAIDIADPGLAQERVIGLFSVNDPVGFSRSVALSLNASLHVERDRVRLSR